MKHFCRTIVDLAITMGLLAQVALAQKSTSPAPAPPAPSAPSPSSAPSSLGSTIPSGSQLGQPDEDRVMFLRGRVATDDGTAVPFDMLVERICKNKVIQQVYTAFRGEFNMQLGSMMDSVLDATADGPNHPGVPTPASVTGIPREQLSSCELRATGSGFRSDTVILAGLTSIGGTIDTGAIVIHRNGKVEGNTLSAVPYKAPKDARKAYEKGLVAEHDGKFVNATQDFQKAVDLYPKFAYAWFQLGHVLQLENLQDAARAAFTNATGADTSYLPPYLALAVMAFDAENWSEVLTYTNHIMEVDPMNHSKVAGGIVDLDPLDCSDAYFYSAVANFKLNRFEEAEKIGLKAEQRVSLPSRFPSLHLILAEIYARQKSYPNAIAEMQAFLELVPHASNANQVRQQLAKLETLNASALNNQSPPPK